MQEEVLSIGKHMDVKRINVIGFVSELDRFLRVHWCILYTHGHTGH